MVGLILYLLYLGFILTLGYWAVILTIKYPFFMVLWIALFVQKVQARKKMEQREQEEHYKDFDY